MHGRYVFIRYYIPRTAVDFGLVIRVLTNAVPNTSIIYASAGRWGADLGNPVLFVVSSSSTEAWLFPWICVQVDPASSKYEYCIQPEGMLGALGNPWLHF